MTWYATTSGDDWIVRKGADFQVYNGDGISDNASLHDNHFEVDGHMTALDGEGLDIYGYNASISIASSGLIKTAHGYGIAFETTAYDGHLENHGTITSDFSGVSISGASPVSGRQRAAEIINFGRITAGEQNGIYSSSDDLTVVNKHSGIITGGQYGYGVTSVENDVTVVNDGMIKGNFQGAIGLGTGNDRVVNSGHVVGNILLNNGNDTYVDKGGSVDGVINAGVGADTYIIHHKGLVLHEDDFSDVDTVKASISWTLGENFERLVLTGRHRLDGTGNDGADTLIGNGKRNVLDGLGGDDMLKGGKGADTFVFTSGSGHDTIADFGHGRDRIDLSGYAGIDGFKDVDIAKRAHDTVITLSAMDTITLQDMAPQHLSASDFLF
jgi:Ca2+-binding RTX toxin-like protein